MPVDLRCCKIDTIFALFIPHCGHRQERYLGEQIDPKNGEAKRLLFVFNIGAKNISFYFQATFRIKSNNLVPRVSHLTVA